MLSILLELVSLIIERDYHLKVSTVQYTAFSREMTLYQVIQKAKRQKRKLSVSVL